MNKVILIGRLTADPELQFTQGGTAYSSVAVAVDRDYKPENGERETDFVPVTVWGKSAENLAKYMTKGRQVAVEGRIQIDKYEKDGQKRTATKVVASRVEFLGGGKAQGQAPAQAQPQGYLDTVVPARSASGDVIGEEVSFSDADLPF